VTHGYSSDKVSQLLPSWTYAAALASLPLQTHTRLRRLLSDQDPIEAWHAVVTGQYSDPRNPEHVRDAWTHVDRQTPQKMRDACMQHGINVITNHDAAYPVLLRDDPTTPSVLFYKGALSHLAHRRVAIIGTRNATRRGRYFASQLAAQLSVHDVAVVSGLARGIDVAAHTGIRSLETKVGAPPIAVVASGIDVVYPREHNVIWQYVAENGLIVSEAPPGTRPEAHLFPLRNRILAALSEVVVVVESSAAGGSMITVREAAKRGRAVMAVPGAPNDRASVGTNALLRDGCAPVTDVDDVLVALSMDHRNANTFFDDRAAPTNEEATVVNVLGNGAATVDMIALSLGVDVLHVAVCLGRLESKGWVAHERGWWEALR